MATLSTIVSFTGNYGTAPGSQSLSSLMEDANGDLIGSTEGGGSGGGGEVFEIKNNGSVSAPVYSSAPTILAKFSLYVPGPLGYYPTSQLVADSAGNLFGTTQDGGANGYGAVFEIPLEANGQYGAAELVSTFDGAKTGNPEGNLIIDSQGNIYGEAYTGASGKGSIFEVAKTNGVYASTPTALVTFQGTGTTGMPGSTPNWLITDSAGNLIGVTIFGGADGDGEVFEVSATGGGFTVLANFSGGTASGAGPGGLVADSQGDLFGTTATGGANNDGVIYEIPKTASGYGPLQILASFNGSNGASSRASLTIDAAGNLFGTSPAGGDNGYGVVFELQKDASSPTGYAASPTLVASFDGTSPDGARPYSNLLADGAGNLLGTTAYGGDRNADGVVFEVTGSGFQTPSCFCRGTRIAAENAAIAVENLRLGDLVRTASGDSRPVVWIGRRAVSARFADPTRCWPIRVKAGALGENVPGRDLLLSPDHALLVGDALFHAGALVNGTSIVRVTRVPETFIYYHVELDDHSLILAENAPAETFVDNVDRMGFDNWAEHEALFPNGKPVDEMPYPRAKSRRQVPPSLRAALDRRAAAIGAIESAAVA